ncbi:hypothetical protein ZWY2020_024000 [Hordeum vulgare]|nr:hypothetical protein ZWY2020_024000 [Hordeum vulgare]
MTAGEETRPSAAARPTGRGTDGGGLGDCAPAGGTRLGGAGPHVPAHAAISPAFRAAADSDDVWASFLSPDGLSSLADGEPSGPAPPSSKKELFLCLSAGPALLQVRLVSMWLDRETGAKCYMISVRNLFIMWGNTPEYWSWIPLQDSRLEPLPFSAALHRASAVQRAAPPQRPPLSAFGRPPSSRPKRAAARSPSPRPLFAPALCLRCPPPAPRRSVPPPPQRVRVQPVSGELGVVARQGRPVRMIASSWGEGGEALRWRR